MLSCSYAAEHLARLTPLNALLMQEQCAHRSMRIGQGPIPTVHRKPRRMAPTFESPRRGLLFLVAQTLVCGSGTHVYGSCGHRLKSMLLPFD